VVSKADLAAVHAAALRVLERTGILVHDDSAVVVHVARPLHGSRPAVRDGPPLFASASGPANVAEGDRLRPGTLEDLEIAVKLGHVSSAIALHGDGIAPLALEDAQRTRRGTHASSSATRPSSGWRLPMTTSTWRWPSTRSSSAPSGNARPAP